MAKILVRSTALGRAGIEVTSDFGLAVIEEMKKAGHEGCPCCGSTAEVGHDEFCRLVKDAFKTGGKLAPVGDE